MENCSVNSTDKKVLPHNSTFLNGILETFKYNMNIFPKISLLFFFTKTTLSCSSFGRHSIAE